MKRLFILSIIVAAAVAGHSCSMFSNEKKGTTDVWPQDNFNFRKYKNVYNFYEPWKTFNGRIHRIICTRGFGEDNFGEITMRPGNITEIYSYNTYGKLIEIADQNSDGSIGSKFIIDYNDAGKPQTTYEYDDDGVMYGKTIYEYDERGFPLSESTYRDNEIAYRVIYECDNSGHIDKTTMYYNRNGSEKDVQTYRYDDKGRIIEVDDDGRIYKYQYDECGNLTRRDMSYGRYISTYNDHGDITKTILYNIDGSVDCTSEYRYEYDNKGNYIKKILFETYNDDRTLIYLYEYKIEYYE